MTVVAVTSVSHTYGAVSALREVSLEFGPGLTGLLGPNGSGKTTLMSLMGGASVPRHGTATVGGRPAHSRVVRNEVGLLLQSRPLNPGWRGLDLVRAVAGLRRLPDPAAAAARALRSVDLGAAADRCVRTYSLGQRQRLLLALAVVHEPPVLLLDEPLNGLDVDHRGRVGDLLREYAAAGRTVVVSSHILPEVEALASGVVVLVGGKVAAIGPIGAVRDLVLAGQHQVRLDCDDARALGSALAGRPWVVALEYPSAEAGENLVLKVTVTDVVALGADLPMTAQRCGVRLRHVAPLNDDLDSVYAALVVP